MKIIKVFFLQIVLLVSSCMHKKELSKMTIKRYNYTMDFYKDNDSIELRKSYEDMGYQFINKYYRLEQLDEYSIPVYNKKDELLYSFIILESDEKPIAFYTTKNIVGQELLFVENFDSIKILGGSSKIFRELSSRPYINYNVIILESKEGFYLEYKN